MKRLLLAITTAGFLAGCVNDIPSKYDHSTVKGSGMTKAELVSRLGIPSRTMKVDDDITTYQWDSDQGISATANSSSRSVGSAYGQSQRYYDGETDAGVIGSSSTVGNSAANITTHECAYSAGINSKSNKVISADLVGTVDNKCLSHFEKMLNLNSTAVTKYNDTKSHDENVHDYAAWWLLNPLGGLFVAIHNKNAVPKYLEPVR